MKIDRLPFFVYRRFCGRTNWNGKRAKAGYHYDSEKVRQIAIDGNELVRQVKNKTASAINRLKREHKRPAEDS